MPFNRATDDAARFNTVKQPSDRSKPQMLAPQAQDSFEEDEDEYNADSPERHEQNLLYKATSSKKSQKEQKLNRQNFKSTDNLNSYNQLGGGAKQDQVN